MEQPKAVLFDAYGTLFDVYSVGLLAELETRLTPAHPDVVRLRRLVADLAEKAAVEQAAEPVRASPDAPAPRPSGATSASERARLSQLASLRT